MTTTPPPGTRAPEPHFRCILCGRQLPHRDGHAARTLRPSLARLLHEEVGAPVEPEGRVCNTCVAHLRARSILHRLQTDRGTLSALESEIARKAAEHTAVTEDLTARMDRRATRGERLADNVARVGGSWPFVASFLLFLLIWMIFNTWALRGHAFDPYPYILLNLVLSCIAALQAPVIMMSQNRAAAKDRLQAAQDFRVNLKAELEIAALHEKFDHLFHTQWERMMEIQTAQLDLLAELKARSTGAAEAAAPAGHRAAQ